MAQHDAAAAQPLGAGGADVIGAQHVDHRRAHHPAVPARPQQAERQRRQDQMGEGAVAADGEPAQLDREDIKQQQADHELRGGHRQERADHQRLVGQPPARQRGHDAHGDAQSQFAEDRGNHQQQGGRQARGDQFRHFGLLQIAAPHVALHQPAQVAPVLHHERLIEAQLLADVFHRLRRGRPPRNLAHRIGGQDIKQKEGDEADPKQDQRRLDQAAQQIGGHQSRPRCIGSSTSRKASPTRLKASASSRIAAPGMNTSQGAD